MLTFEVWSLVVKLRSKFEVHIVKLKSKVDGHSAVCRQFENHPSQLFLYNSDGNSKLQWFLNKVSPAAFSAETELDKKVGICLDALVITSCRNESKKSCLVDKHFDQSWSRHWPENWLTNSST